MASFSALSSLFFSVTLLFVAFFAENRVCNSESTTTTDNDNRGEYLKLPLLHRNPFPSPSEALASDAHRLSVLAGGRHVIKSPVVSGASTGSGQYFVDLQLGSPPQKLLLVVATGSDLVWVRCSACKNCTNHSLGSAFLARHSTTFFPHHCFDPACRLVSHPDPNPCNRTRLHSPCRYEYSYADGSTTSGVFSKETTTLRTSSGRETKLHGLAFGCGFRSSGPSVSGGSFNGAQGVMGLGRGSTSFSSQLGRRFGNKFSYCLMDYTIAPPPTSYLMIGGAAQNGVVSKTPKMTYTPLLINPLSPTFYYIGIKSVFVGGRKLPISPSVWSIDDLGNGGTVMDSGTTLTFLAEPAYRLVLAAFRRRVKLPSSSEPTLGFDLCVNVSGVSRPSLPRLSFGLAGNSVFSPPPMNYFIEAADRVKCLAIQPVDSGAGFSVVGNLMQQGFLFEFDKDRSKLGFTRHGCALP